MPEKIVQEVGFDISDSLRNLSDLNAALGKTNEQLRTLANSGSAVEVNINKVEKATSNYSTSLQLLSRIVFTQAVIKGFREIEDAISHLGELGSKSLDPLIRFFNDSSDSRFNAIGTTLQNLGADLDKVKNPAGQTAENIDKLKTDLSSLAQQGLGAGTAAQVALQPFLATVNSILNGLQQAKQAQDQLKQLPAQQGQLKQLQDALGPNNGLQTGATALQTAVSSMNSSTFPSDLQSAAGALSAAIAAASNAPTPNIATAQNGRVNFFANGGLARGTDRIPAMIGAGESVVNARSTQRFFSQIQALNAGRVPVFQGSSQSSGTGDINMTNHITLNGTDGTRAAARDFARDIKREMRLKRIKRF